MFVKAFWMFTLPSVYIMGSQTGTKNKLGPDDLNSLCGVNEMYALKKKFSFSGPNPDT